MDDNFTSIISAVMWGRNIYDSVRKFLQFQLTVNLVAVCTVFIASLFLTEAILTPVQMLWVNLIMDTFASLALATEPPHPKLLDRHPHNREEYILSKRMMKHVIGQSVFQSIIILFVTFKGETFIPENLRDTDPEVQKIFNDGGGYDVLWKKYNDGSFKNPWGVTKKDRKRF